MCSCRIRASRDGFFGVARSLGEGREVMPSGAAGVRVLTVDYCSCNFCRERN